MTRDDFNLTKWRAGFRIKYQNKIYDIGSVDFEEGLIGFSTEFDDELKWVRCESVELITG